MKPIFLLIVLFLFFTGCASKKPTRFDQNDNYVGLTSLNYAKLKKFKQKEIKRMHDLPLKLLVVPPRRSKIREFNNTKEIFVDSPLTIKEHDILHKWLDKLKEIAFIENYRFLEDLDTEKCAM